MTRNEMTVLINAAWAAAGEDRFWGDYKDVFAATEREIDRILARATSAAEFQSIWENETWWCDSACDA